MNILQLSKSLHRGGVEDHILTLSKGLVKRGNTVFVASDNLCERKAFDSCGIDVIQIDFLKKNPLAVIRNVRKLKKAICENHIDVIHCHWRICAFYIEWMRKLRMTNVPYIWTNHSLKIGSGKLLRLNTFIGSKAVAVSTECKRMLMQRYGIAEGEIELVYNGIAVQKYVKNPEEYNRKVREKYHIEEAFVITMLCRLEPIKNHTCMLRALNCLANQGGLKNVKCIFTGTGADAYKEQLVRKAGELGVGENVIFSGQVDPVDILSITDVMVLPSDFEGFPVSVLEAFAMKVPVIRTRTGGYKDVGEYCLDMDFNNHEQLAEHIRKIMTKQIFLDEMVEQGYQFIQDCCTDEVMTQKIENIYRESLV